MYVGLSSPSWAEFFFFCFSFPGLNATLLYLPIPKITAQAVPLVPHPHYNVTLFSCRWDRSSLLLEEIHLLQDRLQPPRKAPGCSTSYAAGYRTCTLPDESQVES
ncbi:hypothetical protein GGR56DRAFT_660601 [Xylariaceae sp. FL0804]|nr:hypothetical protein GGR56DRAFT_660601 [Xylariaceae sp. FL0804]